MSLAFSDLPIAQGTISADPATFLDDLHILLTSAGWTSATYDNGHLYACVSPQGLAAQVRIWYPDDPDFDNCFAFQWITSTSPISEGLIHHLRSDAARTYSIWANCCSLFIGRPGVTHADLVPWSVCGGIPYTYGLVAPTDQCAAQSPAPPDTTTELWFSAGSDSGVAGFAAATVFSFRDSSYCARFSFSRNSVVSNVTSAIESDALQLGVLAPSGYLNNRRPSGFESGLLFVDGTPLATDPIISVAGIWYGQLYDACLISKPMSLEATETIFESAVPRTTDWINYLDASEHNGLISSLLLLTGTSSGRVCNIAH